MRDPFEDPTEFGPEPIEGEDEPSYDQGCRYSDLPRCGICFPDFGIDSEDRPR